MVPTGADDVLLAAAPEEPAEEFGERVPWEADADWEAWDEDAALPEGDGEADDDEFVVAAGDYGRGVVHR